MSETSNTNNTTPAITSPSSTSSTQSEPRLESSLTAPSDRDLENRWRPDQSSPVLSNEEATLALTDLVNRDFISKFPRVDRTYADPAIPLQTFGLLSFVPAKGATPNEKGVFGFAKLRGNYGTLQEADQRAEYLIRNVDSYHKIFYPYVGRPFPITASSSFSAETSEIDIRKEMTKTISQNIKEQKKEEQKEVNEIKGREERLLEESKKDEEDPYDVYITLRVKKAQLSWTYLEHVKKMEEIRGIIAKTRKEIDEYHSSNPEFKDNYYEKYMKARRDAGIKESDEDAVNNFMKYMVEDAELPGLDIPLVVNPGDEVAEQSGESGGSEEKTIEVVAEVAAVEESR